MPYSVRSRSRDGGMWHGWRRINNGNVGRLCEALISQIILSDIQHCQNNNSFPSPLSQFFFFTLNLCLFHLCFQTGGVCSTVSSPSLFGQSWLRAGLPPLCSQNTAAMPAATKGCQVTHTTLLPHRSHHYKRYWNLEDFLFVCLCSCLSKYSERGYQSVVGGKDAR